MNFETGKIELPALLYLLHKMGFIKLSEDPLFIFELHSQK